MATLQKIRDKGVLLVIVIGLGLFAFIAGDAWKVLQPHQQTRNVGEVAGEDIPYSEFQQEVEELSIVRKMQAGASTLTEQQLLQVRNEVWNSAIANIMIQDQAKELGLTVTDKEIESILIAGSDPLLKNTPFADQKTGAFDYDVLKMFLANYAKMAQSPMRQQYAEQFENTHIFWKWLERTLRANRLFEKYRTLIAQTTLVNNVETETSFADKNNQANLLLACIPYTAIPDSSVQVTNADLEKAYDKKKELFKQDAESRDFKYIDVHVRPSQKDRENLNNEVIGYEKELAKNSNYANVVRKSRSSVPFADVFYAKSAFPQEIASRIDSIKENAVYSTFYNTSDDSYNTFKLIAKTSLADSIEYRHIQVYTQDATQTKELADSIYKALKGGADFKALAKQYSQDKSAGQSTWLTYKSYERATLNDQLVTYINTINNLKKKEIATIDFGPSSMIVQVLNKKEFTPKYKLAVVKRVNKYSSTTFKKAFNGLNSFLAANKSLSSIEKNAEEKGYRVLERKDFMSNEPTIGGIKDTKEAIRWIFKAKPAKVSNIFKCDNNNHLLILALENITEAGYRPISSVTTDLTVEVKRNKKEAAIKELLAAKNIQTVEEAKGWDKVIVDTAKMVNFANPTFVAALRASEPIISAYTAAAVKTTSAPVKGNAGVYLVEPISKSKTNATFDSTTENAQLKQRSAYFMTNMALQALYQEAAVVDNRYLFF